MNSSASTGPFVVAGEALVDIVVTSDGASSQAPGGSPLNVAVGLSRLGHPALLMTQLGDDASGALIRAHLEDSQVDLSSASVRPGSRTSTATATLDDAGSATYEFDLDWSMSPHTLPTDAAGLHVGSIGAALRPGRDSVLGLVEQARERDLLVTFDPNSRPVFTPDAEQAWADVLEVASSAHLVKLSDEDLRFLRPGVAPADIGRDLLSDTTRLVVVTLGGGGAIALSAEAAVEVSTTKVDVVDTVGAGDSFMGALVAMAVEFGLTDLHADRLRATVRAANQVAAITVGRRGANPPRRGELPPGWPDLS